MSDLITGLISCGPQRHGQFPLQSEAQVRGSSEATGEEAAQQH